jgi:uncharacterized Zn-binding protein involved in type VI secretion
MPPAARLTDIHACVAHPDPSPIVSAAATVNIGFKPAARMSDSIACGGTIAMGSPNVFIEKKQAARIGDPTNPPGSIITGFPTVNIGSTPQIAALEQAAAQGTPFLDQSCRLCEDGKT